MCLPIPDTRTTQQNSSVARMAVPHKEVHGHGLLKTILDQGGVLASKNVRLSPASLGIADRNDCALFLEAMPASAAALAPVAVDTARDVDQNKQRSTYWCRQSSAALLPVGTFNTEGPRATGLRHRPQRRCWRRVQLPSQTRSPPCRGGLFHFSTRCYNSGGTSAGNPTMPS